MFVLCLYVWTEISNRVIHLLWVITSEIRGDAPIRFTGFDLDRVTFLYLKSSSVNGFSTILKKSTIFDRVPKWPQLTQLFGPLIQPCYNHTHVTGSQRSRVTLFWQSDCSSVNLIVVYKQMSDWFPSELTKFEDFPSMKLFYLVKDILNSFQIHDLCGKNTITVEIESFAVFKWF